MRDKFELIMTFFLLLLLLLKEKMDRVIKYDIKI